MYKRKTKGNLRENCTEREEGRKTEESERECKGRFISSQKNCRGNTRLYISTHPEIMVSGSRMWTRSLTLIAHLAKAHSFSCSIYLAQSDTASKIRPLKEELRGCFLDAIRTSVSNF